MPTEQACQDHCDNQVQYAVSRRERAFGEQRQREDLERISGYGNGPGQPQFRRLQRSEKIPH
jgi:hypothetical protein